MTSHDKILIVDFGSQVTQLIARRVREEGVYSEIVPYQKAQEAFAAACGLDRTYISGIERGRRNVSLRNIEVIANALSISISELTKGL